MKKLQNIFSKYLIITVACIVGLIGVLSFFFTAYFKATYIEAKEATYYRFDNIIFNLVGLAIMIAIVILYIKLTKKVNVWVILSLVLGISLVTEAIYIYQIRYIPISDQYALCDYANFMLGGGLKQIFDPGRYFNLYPFQTWISIFIAYIFKIFGKNNFLVFQTLNVIASICNMYLLFLITRKLFKEEIVQKVLLLLILGFNLYFVFFNVHVYGNIIGLTFALLSIYMTMLYIDKKQWIWLIFTAFSITIAIFFKSNYNIFMCGIVLLLLLHAMESKSWKSCLGILCIILIYIGTNKIATKIVENKVGVDMPEGVPMLSYVYMGMADSIERSCGWYTEDTVQIYDRNNKDTKAAIAETKILLKQRISYFLEHPKEAMMFYADKQASTWLNPTFQTIWCSLPTDAVFVFFPGYSEHLASKTGIIDMLQGKWYQIEEGYFNIYQIFVFVFASIGMLCVTKKTVTPKMTIIPMLFFGGFLFHLFWETKAIYVLQYYFLLLPFAAYGVYQCLQWMQNRLSRNKLLEETQE